MANSPSWYGVGDGDVVGPIADPGAYVANLWGWGEGRK